MSITNWIFPLVTITVVISNSILPASSDKRSACMSLCGEFMSGGSSLFSGPKRKSGMAGSVSRYKSSSLVAGDVSGDAPASHRHECLPIYPGDCSITCEAAYGAKCSVSCPGSSCTWFRPLHPDNADWEDWACATPGCDDSHFECRNTRCPDYLTELGGGIIGI